MKELIGLIPGMLKSSWKLNQRRRFLLRHPPVFTVEQLYRLDPPENDRLVVAIACSSSALKNSNVLFSASAKYGLVTGAKSYSVGEAYFDWEKGSNFMVHFTSTSLPKEAVDLEFEFDADGNADPQYVTCTLPPSSSSGPQIIRLKTSSLDSLDGALLADQCFEVAVSYIAAIK